MKRKGRKPIQSVNKGITPLAIEGPCPETAPRQTPALSDKPVAYMRTLCVCVCVEVRGDGGEDSSSISSSTVN